MTMNLKLNNEVLSAEQERIRNKILTVKKDPLAADTKSPAPAVKAPETGTLGVCENDRRRKRETTIMENCLVKTREYTANSPGTTADTARMETSGKKEERQRTGRLIAVLAGILLFVVAIYHAWVRRIPIIASLVVPALIMFLYVGWVLFTASKDKLKALNSAAAAAAAASQSEAEPFDVTVVPNIQKPPDHQKSTEDSITNDMKGTARPIILINDELAEGQLLPAIRDLPRIKGLPNRPKFKRKFCRRKRNAVFKRSYSIA